MNRTSTRRRARAFQGALLASTTLTATTAAAADFDSKLALIHEALTPRTSVLRDVLRLSVSPQSPQGGPQQQRTFVFNIPGGTFAEVATALEKATGHTVTVPADAIGVIYSPGVTGTMTFEQALKAITDGTTIAFRMNSETAAVLSLPSLTESVTVSGVLPTVASPKYDAPLRDIPQTIEVIPRQAMESQGVTTLSEALRNVPGVTLQAGEGGGASSTAGDMFNLRGFNASNSIFVDNVRDDGLVSRDVYNLEQVEVFMGPTGSDVGRGTASGYVNMETKTPHMPTAASTQITFGSAGQQRMTFDVNRALSTGDRDSWIAKSAVRLNVLWQDSGVAGRDEVENGSKGISPSIGFGLETPTRLLASGQFLRQDNVPDYGIPGAAWHETKLAPTTVFTDNPVDQTNYYGSPAVDYDKSEQDAGMVRLEHDFSGSSTTRWTVSNQTRYNRTHREAVISTVQNPAAYNHDTDLVTVARQGNERENKIASNQTLLAGRLSTGNLQHSISSGLEFSRESQFAPTLVGLGTRAPVNIYNPNPADPIAGYAPARSAAFTDGETNTQALFVFDSLPVGPRVQVNAGIRWEHYKTEFRSVDASSVTTVNASGDDNLLSGKAGVVIRASRTGNVYFSYGSTATPPGSSNFALSTAANNQNNPNVDPQISYNLEAGSKWDVLDGRLSLTGAFFHTINKNVIFTVDAAAVPPVFNQDDKQQVNGVTLGATGQITPQLHVMASFGYLDSTNLSQNILNNGKRLTLTPEFSGSIWGTCNFAKKWSAGGGVRTTSEVFINAANTIVSPGFHVIDGLVQYDLNEHLSLRANIYNLTDQVYIRSVNNNGGRYNPGNPRTAQLTTVFRF